VSIFYTYRVYNIYPILIEYIVSEYINRRTEMSRLKGHGKDNEYLPKVCVGNEISSAVTELMEKYGLSKSDAIRKILDNGLIYMAIYGDGNET